MAFGFSACTGSSRKNGLYGSKRLPYWIAICGVRRPCRSSRMSTSSPTASRIVLRKASACLSFFGPSSTFVIGTGTVLIAVQPRSTFERALSTAALKPPPRSWPVAVGPVKCVYTRTLSRTRPPSSSYTGTPRSLPLMSHNAWSMPLMADRPITPMRQKPLRYRICQQCSMRRGSWPTIIGSMSWMQPTIARGLPSSVASPQPIRPGWSVSTLTKTMMRWPPSAMIGVMRVIFMMRAGDSRDVACDVTRKDSTRSAIIHAAASPFDIALRARLSASAYHGRPNRLTDQEEVRA